METLFVASPGCFYSDPHEEASFPESSWRHGSSHSTTVTGSSLLNESAVSSEKSHTQSVRRRRRAHDDDDEAKRAARAMSLVQVGELSAHIGHIESTF